MKKFYAIVVFLIIGIYGISAFGQAAGDIIITEIMPNPDAISDADGEYFELFNTTTSDIDIQSWEISDVSSNSHVISSSLIVPANGFIIVGRSSNPMGSDDVSADYVFSSVTLNNSSETIYLKDASGGTTICSATYSSSSSGVAMELDDVTNVSSGHTNSYTNATLTMINGDIGSPGTKGNTVGISGPEISNIGNTPLQPTSSESVSILADVTGNTLSNVEVQWGTTPDNLSNTINMSVTSAPEYSVDNNIPAQSSNTEIYYKVFATDADNTIESILHKYTSFDPPDFVINEFLADPGGDANGDGITNTSDDEFIEFVNKTSSSLDISNWEIHDNTGIQYTVGSSTIIPVDESFVVFGGGNPSGIPGTVQVSSSGLNLNNSGDEIKVYDDNGLLVVSYTYGSEGGDNQSIARDPDYTGAFKKHSDITSNAVSFSPGKANTDGTSLPVNLLYFQAQAQSNGNLLSWATAAEQNNAYFSIEYSLDGKAFELLTEIPGNGNSNSIREYEYLHMEKPVQGYYRLSQTDYDGTRKQLKTVDISAHEQSETPLLIEMKGHEQLLLKGLKAAETIICIYNAAGSCVYTKTIKTSAGQSLLNLPPELLKSGIYFIHVNDSYRSASLKILH